MGPTFTPTARPQPKPQTPTSSAPSWAKWLPTAGSIAGSIGGDVLGGLATIPTGGLINPWDTSTALSALGGGVGQAIDNGMQGKNPLQLNDLEQAGIAGGSNLLGLGIGKGLGALGGKLAQTGSDMADQAAAKAATDTATQAETKNAIYGEAMGAKNAPYLKNGFQTVLNNAENLGVNTTDKGAPALMSAIGHSATGGSEAGKGVVNDMVDNILSNHGGTVNLSGDVNGDSLSSNLAHSAEEQTAKGLNAGNLEDTTVVGKKIAPANNIVQQFAKQVAAMSPKLQSATGTDLLAQNMTTQEADALAKNLSKVAFDGSALPAEGAARDAMIAKRNMARDLFSYVRGAVDQQPGLDQAVQSAVSDPQLSAKIDEATANISDPAVRQAVKSDLTTKLAGAKNIQDLRALQSDYVDMAKLGDHVNFHNTQNTFTLGAKKLDNLGTQTAEKGLMGKVAPLAKVGLAGASILDPHQNSLLRIAEVAPEISTLLDNPTLLTKLGGAGGILGGVANVPATALGSIIAAPNQPQGGQQMPQVPTMPNPYAAPLQNAQQIQAMQAVDPSMGTGGNAAQSVTSLTQDSQKFNAAVAGLKNLMSLYDQAGGAQGPMGGILSSLQSIFTGGEASRYNNAAQQEATQLQQLTGTPTQGITPSIYENQPTAQKNLQAMVNILSSLSPQG